MEFFEKLEHLRMPSFPLKPDRDPTLLVINAGMAPFKRAFLGLEEPPARRVTTYQKCVRTVDMEDVGKDPTHLTFFQMLGNFSFGDYFKEEIIPWSLDLLENGFKIPREKLVFTVYKDDHEAYEIWTKKVGIPEDRVFRLGMEHNFWSAGDTGPCGPDSEIFFDFGPQAGSGKPNESPADDTGRFLEIWNLVFMQYNRDEEGNLTDLPNRNVDTGAGLERIAAVIQGKHSVYDNDQFAPICAAVSEMADQDKLNSDWFRQQQINSVWLIADHLRSIAFMLGDEIYPSNLGRGYVLRRLIRRASIHARKIGIPENQLHTLVPIVFQSAVKIYPELQEKQEYVGRVLKNEERQFNSTLNKVGPRLREEMASAESVFPGDRAFYYYDTLGLPYEVQEEIAAARSLVIDREGFEEALAEQQRRSQAEAATEFPAEQGVEIAQGQKLSPTEFIGYEKLKWDGQIVDIIEDERDLKVFFDKTPFYAESGGQVSDKGWLILDDVRYEVTDVQKMAGRVAHLVSKSNQFIDKLNLAYERGHTLRLKVDPAHRHGVARAHTATHLLHAALKAVVGFHVNQAGSKVEFDRLTFDFTHFQPLTHDELAQIEEKVNTEVLRNYPVHVEQMDYEEAVGEGAVALFGEKYSDKVRVVSVGGQGRTRVSSELCGGTHLPCIAEIGVMKIVKEESMASGVRRIEAYTGLKAQEYLFGYTTDLINIAEKMHSPVDSAVSAVEKLAQEAKEREKKIRKLEDRLSNATANRILELLDNPDGQLVTREGNRLAAAIVVDGFSQEALRRLAETVAEGAEGAAACVVDKEGPKLRVVVAVNKQLIAEGVKAGALVKEVCGILKGGGGGKPDLAEGGGSDPGQLQAAFDRFREMLR